MPLRKLWTLAISLVLLGVFLFVVSYMASWRWSVLTVAGVVFMLAGLIIRIAKFRCPSCGRQVPGYISLPPTYCPFCGASLEENHKDR